MKKIYWILALIVLFFVGDRIGGFILGKMVEHSQFRYSRMYTGNAEADILLVGNSRGLIFYQPHISESTGKSNFNLSYNGMSMDLASVLVADYYERYQAPKTLLIDVTMCDRENDQLSIGFNCYSPYSPRLGSFLLTKAPSSAYAGKLTHLYRYNSEVFQRALSYINRSDENWLTDRIINDHMVANVAAEEGLNFTFVDKEDKKKKEKKTYGGPYVLKWLKNNVGLNLTLSDKDEDKKGDKNFDEEYILQCLKNTVALAQAKGTEVHLVINPYYPEFAKKSRGYADWKKRITKATGLKVNDYSMALSERDAFGDYQHLNKKGSIEYLDILKKDGLLK